MEKTDPAKFLASVTGSPVVVSLNNGVEFHGSLQSIDGYMNVVLNDASEHANESRLQDYGSVFIRGNNGMCASTNPSVGH